MAVFVLTASRDNFAGRSDQDNLFDFTPSTLQSIDTIIGGAAGPFSDIGVLTGPGTVNAAQFAGVSGLEELDLSYPGNSVTLTDALVSGSSKGFFAVVEATEAAAEVSSWHAAATADFEGNGSADVLWSNDDGAVAIWQVHGNQLQVGAMAGVTGPTWHVATTADFNGDGRADIVFRSNDGAVAIWEMDGTQVQLGTGVASTSISWKIVGAADFTGDGQADILFQNDDGSVAIWRMNGTHLVSGGSVGSPGASWHVAGTADFTGDGQTDILLHNDDGAVAIWRMNGTDLVSGGTIGSIGPSWHIAGTADFNGDGQTDILFRSDDGSVAIWQMNGTQVQVGTGVGGAPPSSEIIGTGDYNGDGNADIMFHNADGSLTVWTMNGPQLVSSDPVVRHGNDQIDASSVSSGNAVHAFIGGGRDTYTGGAGVDAVYVSSLNLGSGDVISGGDGGADALLITDANARVTGGQLANVTGFEILSLAEANNTTVTFSGADVLHMATPSNFLYVLGHGDDHVNAGDNWTLINSGVTNGALAPGYTFTEYQHATNGVELFIADGIALTIGTTPDTAPVIDLNGPGSDVDTAGFNYTTVYTTGNPDGHSIAAPTGTLDDPDPIGVNSRIVNLTAHLTNPQANDSTIREFLVLSFAGHTIATDNGLTVTGDNTSTVTITGISSDGVYQSLMREIQYVDLDLRPAGDYTTPRVVTVDAQDQGGLSAIEHTTTFVLTKGDTPPVANDDTASATEASGLVNDVPGTDPSGNVVTGPGPGTDTDFEDPSSALIVITVGTGAEGSGSSASNVDNPLQGTYGTLLLHSDGSYTYTVDNTNPLVDALAPGQSVDDVFNYRIQDSHAGADGATLTITIHGADDFPVALDDNPTILEDAGAVAIDVLGNDTDVDGGPKSIASFTQPSHGTVAGVGPAGAWTSLTYQPDSDYNNAPGSEDTFTYTLNGGSTAQVSVTVTPVNDAPLGADNTFTLLEDGSHNFAASDFGFSDPVDAANASGANAFQAVIITALPAAGTGTLTLSGIPVTAGQSIGVADIGGLVFTPAANANGTPEASFTFQVQDNGGIANGGVDTDPSANTITFNVTPVNDAPAGADASFTILEDGSHNFAASDFGFTDPVDAANASGTNAFQAVIITALPAAGTGTLALSGTPVTVGQSIAVADIPNLVFTPAANANGTPDASFTFQVQDNGGIANGGVDTDPSANTITFNVTPVNDAPLGADNTFTLLEDGSHAFTAADFGFSDPVDAANASGANAFQAVIITALPAAGTGTLTLSGIPVTAGQSIAVADIGGLVFTPAANANGTPEASFTFQVQDNGGIANGGVDTDPSANTITFNVNPVNDAPAGADNTFTLLEDGSHAFAASDFGFTDPVDAANASGANAFQAVIITALPAAGTGTLALSGTPVTVGQSIAVADIPNLVFTPAANANGTPEASFTFQVQDNGGIANGGVDTDPSANTITFNVNPVNDAPLGADNTFTLLEDGSHAFAASDFGFTDPVDAANASGANAFQAVIITALPAAGTGTLALSGTPVTVGQSIAVADIPNLVFTPAANANGTPDASFTFQVQDNGGIANGGVDTDPSANTITFNVTPVNDAPSLVATGENPNYSAGVDLFSAVTASTGPANELAQLLKTLVLTVSNVSGTVNEFLTIDGTEVDLTDTNNVVTTGPLGVTASVTVAAGTATVAITSAPGLSETDMANLVDGLSYTDTNVTPGDNPRVVTLTSLQDNGGTANAGVDTTTLSITSTVTFNQPPAIDSNGSGDIAAVSVAENQTAVTTVHATDPDSGPSPVSYSIAGGDDQLKFAIDSSTGVLTFVTAPDFENPTDTSTAGNNTYIVTVQASDGAATDQQTITVTVTNVNEAPVNTVPGPQSTAEDTAKAIAGVTVADDSDPLTTTLSVLHGAVSVTAGGGATIANNSTGTVTISGTPTQVNAALAGLTYTNTPDYNGTDTLTVATSDGALTDTDTIALTVTPVVDIANDTATTNEDTPANINVNANDTFENAGHTITAVNGTAIASGGTVSVTNGAVTSNVDGTLTFAPSANYNGPASFTYTVTSGGVTETATVHVTVNAVNDAPTFITPASTTSAEDAGAQSISNFVTAISPGPADESAQTVSFSVTGNNNAGLFSVAPSIAADGTLTYTAAPNANGTATITVVGQDDGGTDNGGVDTSASHNFNINVTAVNDAPTAAVPSNASVGTAFSHTDLAISGLSVADIDAGSGNVTATISSSHGALTFNTTGLASSATNGTHSVTLTGTVSAVNTALGTLVYNSDDTYTGSDTVSLNVNDNGNTGTGGALTSGASSFQVGVVPQVWYIDNTNGGAGTGAGTSADPFHSITAFNASAGPGTGDYIVLRTGTGTYAGDGINLQNNQQLYGSGETLSFTNPVTGATVTVLNGSGARPTINVTTAGDQGIDLAQNNTIHGINILTGTGTTGLDDGQGANGNSVGTLTVDHMQISGVGQAVDIDQGGNLSVSLESLSSTGGAEGVQLAATGATLSGTFSAIGGTISGSTTAGFMVGDGAGGALTGGSVAITYGGTITTTGAAHAVDIQDRVGAAGNITLSGTISHASGNGTSIFLDQNAAGTITFSGANSVLNSGTADAVHLTNNAGATINFTGGGLDIDTTSGAGFLATGGGPAATTGGTVTVTGTGNHLTSTTGTALNITNTTIGASNVTFQDVSANGGANGIVLNNTGATGHLAVTGTGAANSGGTIQNTTGAGISLTSTLSPTFNDINVQSTGGSGINGTDVTNFTLTNSTINNSGNALLEFEYRIQHQPERSD